MVTGNVADGVVLSGSSIRSDRASLERGQLNDDARGNIRLPRVATP